MLFRNTLWQSLPLVTGYAFSLLLAPLMLSRLGLAAFGIWAVTGAIATYAALLDLGLRRTLARFVALYDAQGDQRAIRELVGLGLLVTLAVAVVMLGAAAAAAPVIADALDVRSDADMRIILMSSATVLVGYTLKNVFDAVGVGRRLMKPPSVATLAGNATNFAFSVAALIVSSELTVYAIANGAASLVGVAYSAVAVRWVWRGSLVAWPTVARSREVLRFSITNQVPWFGDLVNQETDKIIIALLVGPRAAGAYEVANRAVLAVRSLGFLTVSAMVPTATAAIVERGREVIREFYVRYTLRSVSIAFPMLCATCLSAPYLLMAWLGEVSEHSELIVLLLSAAYLGSVITLVPNTLVTADGRPGTWARATTGMAVLNILLTIALAPLLGTWGVLLGTFGALTIGNAAFVWVFHRLYDLPRSDLVAAAARPAALALALMVPFGSYYLFADPIPESRGEAAIGLLFTAVPYSIAYWLAASRLRYLPERLSAGVVRRRFQQASTPSAG